MTLHISELAQCATQHVGPVLIILLPHVTSTMSMIELAHSPDTHDMLWCQLRVFFTTYKTGISPSSANRCILGKCI